MSASRPHVVALTPAYRCASFVEPVLRSLAAQTYPQLQILISVDACDDGTAELCERFAAAHERVTVIRQPKRLGWIGNSNALLAAAAGDACFFAFHDDPLDPAYVERLVAALAAHPEAVLAFSDIESNHGPMRYAHLDGVDDRFERVRRFLFVYGNWWIPLRGLIRREAIDAVGPLRPLAFGEKGTEWPWLLRLLLRGTFMRVPEPLLHKEFRTAGLAASWRASVRNDLALSLALGRIFVGAPLPLLQRLYLLAQLVPGKHRVRALLRRARTS